MHERGESVAAAGSRSGLRRLYGVLWHYAEGIRHQVVAFLALLFLAQAVRLSVPYFFGQAANALQTSGIQGAAGQDVAAAAWNIGMMVAACALGWALHGPGRVIERFTAIRLRERFADDLYARAVALPMRWHDSHHSGETIQRMTKASGALFGFAQHQFVYLQNMISVAGPIVALFFLSTAAGMAALAGYGLIGLILARFDAVMVGLVRKENAAEGRYLAELVDCLGNISTVLTLRLQGATRRSVAARHAAISVPLRRTVVLNEGKWGAIDLLNNALGAGLVVLYAGLAWRENGVILVGSAVMVHQYAQQVATVVTSMAGHWQDLLRHKTDIASADDILQGPGRGPGAAGLGADTIAADWRRIQVAGLSFHHAGKRSERPTLDDLAFTLRRGGRTALVGESGSGKSTLLRVLAGLYEADRIAVAVDGAPHHVTDLGSIAILVPQDPEVFESSIGQNLTMGIDYTPAEVARACALACLAPVIARLPQGLDTPITERGLNLSGGQKQRLALARGILAARGASLIMLDEPTSSVDPATEARLYTSLLSEFPDACVVSTLHRLHLLPHFDTVVFMADGRIVDIGTREDLLARQPHFRTLWQNARGAEAGNGPVNAEVATAGARG